jgi:hypothetical protein
MEYADGGDMSDMVDRQLSAQVRPRHIDSIAAALR